MLRWVEQGNTLLLLSKKADALQPRPQRRADRGRDAGKADVRPRSRSIPTSIRRSATSATFTLSASAAKARCRQGRGRCRFGGSVKARIGRPARWSLRQGKGRVIVVADPSLATYSGLWDRKDGQATLRDDNVWFLVNVATLDAAGRQGLLRRVSPRFPVRRRPVGLSALSRASPVARRRCSWSWRRRFGRRRCGWVRRRRRRKRPKPTRWITHPPLPASISRPAPVGGWRGRCARGFLGALTGQLRLRRNALPAEVLAAWRLHDPGASGERLQGLLRGVAALRKGDVTEKELLHWSQAFDQFRREMQDAERGRMGLKAKRGQVRAVRKR